MVSIFVNAQSGSLAGKVVDSDSGDVLVYSTVRLLQLPDSTLYMGTITGENGTFILQNIAHGSYLCWHSSVGYQKETIPVIFSKEKQQIDLGIIKLAPVTIILEGAEILSQSPVVTKLDRTVYRIDSSLLVGTTTTIDLMKKLPELSVNQAEDAVSIKGVKGTMVMLNGVLNSSELKLKTIDPQNIEKIEIITEPSSEYDADIGGVVNIILKEEVPQGYAIFFDANYLTPLNRIEISPSFSYNWKKVRYHFSYGYSYWGRKFQDTIYREYVNESQRDVYQSITKPEKYQEQSHSIENRLDYYINKSNFINLTLSNNYNPRVVSYNTFATSNVNDSLLSKISSSAQGQDKYTTGNYTVFYRKNFTKDDAHKLTVNFNFHHMKAKSTSEYDMDKTIDNIVFNDLIRSESTNATRYSYNLKADYYHPISDKFGYNMGVLGYYQILNNKFEDRENRDTAYRYQNFRPHVYIDLLFKINKFNFRIGNKVERYFTYMESQSIINKAEYLPSFTASRNFSKFHTLSLNFRTVCNYPSVWTLTPYAVYSSDSTSAHKGNPELEPQTRYTANMTYIFRKGNSMLRTILSYSYVKNMFTQQINLSEQNTVMKQMVNMPGRTAWTFTAIYDYDYDLFSAGGFVIPFFEYFDNANGYRQNISCNFSLYNYWYLPLDFEIDVEFFHGGKNLTPNGYYTTKPTLDVYLSKSFLKGDMKILFGYTGLFSPKEYTNVTEQYNLYEWDKYDSGFKGFLFKFTYFLRSGKTYEKEFLEQYNDNDIK